MLGGIPNRDIEDLENYWHAYPSLKSELFAATTRASYSQLKIEPANIKNAIYTHPEFEKFVSQTKEVFNAWRDKHTSTLKNIEIGAKPKALINELSEDILQAFSNIHLVDKYDIYQGLMVYWSDIMQDDAYMIAVDGWLANEDLIPPKLIIARYFAAEQKAIEQLEADKESATREREELEEEHSGEDGFLEERKNDSGKVNKAEVQKRVRELKGLFASKNPDEKEELKVLEQYLSLVDQESAATKKIKEAKAALDKKVKDKYKTLSLDEIKQLVVDDKWMATLESAVQSELERVSQNLTQRIKTLAERYNKPLPEITAEIDELTKKVNEHLQKMEFVCK